MRTTVGTTVDADGALALLQRVGPDYAWHADALRATAAAMAEEDVPDCALHAALAYRPVSLARSTFLYLRWKLETGGPSEAAVPGSAAAAAGAAARAARAKVRAEVRAARAARAAVPARVRTAARARATTEAAAAGARLIRDGEGRRWHVAEADPDALVGAERPRWLVFTSGGRQWHVHACPTI
jgi:hypothetical protein